MMYFLAVESGALSHDKHQVPALAYTFVFFHRNGAPRHRFHLVDFYFCVAAFNGQFAAVWRLPGSFQGPTL
jgi:hypothetical protein